jgi:hypothetical protein
MSGLNPPILLILAYGRTTSANRSLSYGKRDRSTIAKPIRAIAHSKDCDRPNPSSHRKNAIACLMSEHDLSAIAQSKDCDRPLSIVIYARIEKSITDWIV